MQGISTHLLPGWAPTGVCRVEGGRWGLQPPGLRGAGSASCRDSSLSLPAFYQEDSPQGPCSKKPTVGGAAGQRPDHPHVQTGSSPVWRGLGGRELEPGADLLAGRRGPPARNAKDGLSGEVAWEPWPFPLLSAKGPPRDTCGCHAHLATLGRSGACKPPTLWPGAPRAGTGRGKTPKGSKDRLEKLRGERGMAAAGPSHRCAAGGSQKESTSGRGGSRGCHGAHYPWALGGEWRRMPTPLKTQARPHPMQAPLQPQAMTAGSQASPGCPQARRSQKTPG